MSFGREDVQCSEPLLGAQPIDKDELNENILLSSGSDFSDSSSNSMVLSWSPKENKKIVPKISEVKPIAASQRAMPAMGTLAEASRNDHEEKEVNRENRGATNKSMSYPNESRDSSMTKTAPGGVDFAIREPPPTE
eukprot:13336256-Ditylum_brightwellii.AAC.1